MGGNQQVGGGLVCVFFFVTEERSTKSVLLCLKIWSSPYRRRKKRVEMLVSNKRFSVEGLVSFLSDNRDRVKYTLNTVCDYIAEKDLQEVLLAVTQKIPKRQRLNVLKAAKETWEELQE